MKKQLCCLLILLCILFSACGNDRIQKIEQPFTLYFLNTSASNGALFACTVSMDVENMTAQEIVQAYLSAVPPQGTKSPFVWTLDSVYLEDATLQVIFAGQSATRRENYLAAACLSKTMTQLACIETVCLLAPAMEEAICLSADDILLQDTAMLPQQETITLYLPDRTGRFLVRHMQKVEAMEPSEKPQYIMEQLLSLTGEDSFIPQGTSLLSIRVDNGLCRVCLSSDFVLKMHKSFAAERLAVYSIVNSLTELPQIATVDIWIGDAPLDKLTFMALPAGLERNEAIVYAYDQIAVELYLPCDSGQLVAVPQQLSDEQDALQKNLIYALITFEGGDGISNPIPEGTQILNVRTEGNACILDLSGEFLSQCRSDRDERLAVDSIVATLCALEGIDSVEILVEGLQPAYRNSALRDVRRPRSEWYAE